MKLLIFACLVTFSFAAIAVYPLKVGDKLELSLGSEIKKWTRIRTENIEETIQYCLNGDNSLHCSNFVDKDEKITEPKSDGAKVTEKGVLVIEKVKKSDSGSYFTKDQNSELKDQFVVKVD